MRRGKWGWLSPHGTRGCPAVSGPGLRVTLASPAPGLPVPHATACVSVCFEEKMNFCGGICRHSRDLDINF